MIRYEIAKDNPDAVKIVYMFEEKALNYCDNFTYVSLIVDDWNSELSPWAYSFGKMHFAGNGKSTLEQLKGIITEVECGRRIKKRFIAGYSLGALFSLYALAETDMFAGAASCSASMWFKDFVEYLIGKNNLSDKMIYLSLGDREENTRNQVMATVGDNTRRLYQYLERVGCNCTLVMNEGGHFNDPDKRVQKGLDWLSENGKA